MICNHVAQSSGLFVVTRACANTTSFSRGDLDVVDIVAIPDRLEHRISETKDKYVLHRIFAEVVIDAINLTLFEHLGNGGVQSFRRFEISPERFFNDDPAPMIVFVCKICLAQAFHDRGSKRRRCREIEELIFAGACGD